VTAPPAVNAEASVSAPIASLAMYDWPELQGANDTLWSAIASRLASQEVRAPPRLTRGLDLEAVWTSPTLLLGQTCGYPLATRLGDRVRLVATPRYRAPGCEGPFRRSAIVVAADAPVRRLSELRGARCALNDHNSDSGMNLLRGAIAPLAVGAPGFFSEVIVTGSHLASAEAIAAGAADVAALDAVCWAHLRRLRPAVARRLRVLDWTDATPGLPLVTATGTDAATVRALQNALADVALDPDLADTRVMLLLEGFSVLPPSAYRSTLDIERRARALGYSHLA
jgi:ABC-type phosphate/phosphonate transport system substrate-binding protein